MDDETELTEMVDIKVTRQDGVRTPASGYGFLVMKAVGANGAVNEKPDIAGANKVLALLAQLVASEAEELAAGCEGETNDIRLLLDTISNMRWFRDGEQMNAEMAKDVAAVNNLIKSLGDTVVPDATPAPEGAAPTQTPATTEPQAGELLSKEAQELVAKMIEGAVGAKVSEIAEERDKALAELAVLKDTPLPGGPALTATAAVRDDKAKAEAVVKAAYWERRAERATDPEAVRHYRGLAEEAKTAAK